ncbi:MAG: hypothetical protein IJU83_03155 [Clostridia bacterium]|nr:hypothetical protein [Clostridia bacterium]
MAVVEMSKIKLMSVNVHKEKILNALYGTGCVELSETEEFTDTFRASMVESIEDVSAKYEKLSRAISFYTEIIERSKNAPYCPKNISVNSNFFLTYDEFIRSPEKAERCFDQAAKSRGFADELSYIKAEKTKINNLNAALIPYLGVENAFSEFVDTKTTRVYYGTIKKDDIAFIRTAVSELKTVGFSVLAEGQISVILVISSKDNATAVSEILAERNFNACPFKFDVSAKLKIEENALKLKEFDEKENEIYKDVCENAADLKDLKILSDYYGFLMEKEREKENFSYTDKTFILEGFVPTEKIADVEHAIHIVSDAIVMEFSAPQSGETVPTLLKNGFVVRQTEFVTDLYSTPSYKEKDPNRAVFFFFMLFMGVIMADIGYGVVMIALGLFLAKRIKVDNGSRRLWYNIAFGGVSAIIFGVLFNSLFGISVIPFTVLPSPVPSVGGTTGLMTILLGCLALGVIQIAFGYFMKALNCFRSGDIAGGIFDGLCWVAFFIGFVFASFNFLVGYLMPEAFATMNAGVKGFFNAATMPGLILTAVSLLFAAGAAGRAEKGIGKITKGFGAIYGLINIFSDILSYARLFGLMLSGMIKAQTFNDIGSSLFANGIVGYIAGILVIIIGHVFNLAMGVLGAYIHDSRLQYIEFFGKFYTGEGNKFKPMGSDFKYVYVTK